MTKKQVRDLKSILTFIFITIGFFLYEPLKDTIDPAIYIFGGLLLAVFLGHGIGSLIPVKKSKRKTKKKSHNL